MKNTKDAMDYVAGLNSRKREMRPSILRRIGKLYVFSLYWHEFTVNLGHQGSVRIPAFNKNDPKQARRGYSDPLVLPEIFAEEYDKLSGELGLRLWDALPNDDDPQGQPGVISDVLGLNSSQPGLSAFTTNRSWFGIFVATGYEATPAEVKRWKENGEVWNFPTARELELAKEKLTAMMERLYADAEGKALQGPAGLKEIQPTEREAAEYLGLNPDWSRRKTAKAFCPACNGPIDPGMFVHFVSQGGCGAVLDEDKVRQYKTPGYEHIWGVKQSPAAAAGK